MKFIIFFISLLALTFKVELTEVRLLYKEADLSETRAIALHKKLQSVTKNDNKVLVAYKGAATTLQAKYQNGISLKKETFVKGAALIEYAIENQPNNIEIRFVRLSVQQNIPKFLKYNKNLDEDKKFILNNFNKKNSPMLASVVKRKV